MDEQREENKIRILIAEDEEPTIEIYKDIFMATETNNSLLSELEAKAGDLFNFKQKQTADIIFEVEIHRQGKDAVESVQSSVKEERPFSLAFIDVRMPPGHDGIWTAEQISILDPHIITIIATGHADYHPSEITKRFSSASHQLFYLEKPFHAYEVYQLAHALGEKWLMQRELRELYCGLEQRVAQRTLDLYLTNEQLELEIEKRKGIHEQLVDKSLKLEEMNIALNVLLEKRDKDKVDLEEKVLSTVKKLIMPYIDKLKESYLKDSQQIIVNALESNLLQLTSSFARDISHDYQNFTPAELQVADLIRQGKSTKEISDVLNVSVRTVESHRKNIREKIGIKNKKLNLRSYLETMHLNDSPTN